MRTEPTHFRRRCRGGFTLLELLVVAMLGVLVITFISDAWIWYVRSVKQVQVDAHLNRELKLAADAIAQDFGPSIAARTPDGVIVQFDFDDDGNSAAQWVAPDTVVEYVVQSGNLVRRNLSTGEDVPLAANISEVTAELTGGHLNVHLVAAYRDEEQGVTLQLQEP
jgi:type II secretory pathway pseudopilin PulG